MKKDVDATLNLRGYQAATSLLLRALPLDRDGGAGAFLRAIRLEEAIGPELTRRLVTSLTARSPRREPVA